MKNLQNDNYLKILRSCGYEEYARYAKDRFNENQLEPLKKLITQLCSGKSSEELKKIRSLYLEKYKGKY
ncbi:MAG: hypothetical protein ACQEQS_02345 [Thermodesulfobacteriota bacterium]